MSSYCQGQNERADVLAIPSNCVFCIGNGYIEMPRNGLGYVTDLNFTYALF